MNRILVIGGTGNVGRQVVCRLAATGARCRAMVRNPDTAGLPPEVEVVRGDLTVPETLDRCLHDTLVNAALTKPVIYWTPIIAPGNLMFYNGAMFPQWRGSALMS